MKALEGLTVLDLTHMLSGPYATMLLADMGARTIKVEPPGKGEGTRRLLEGSPEFSRDGMGAYFLTLNRNKQSVAIDLKSEAGLALFYRLAEKADILRNAIIQALMCDFALSFPALEARFAIRFADYFASELEDLRDLASAGLLDLDAQGLVVSARGRMLVRIIAMVFDRYLRSDQAQRRYSRVI